MKKIIALLLVLTLSLSAVPAMAELRTERSFYKEFISLEEVFARLVEGNFYKAGLLSVELVFTESFDVRLDVEVDEERVDYLLLNDQDWCCFNGTVLVDESVIDALVKNEEQSRHMSL